MKSPPVGSVLIKFGGSIAGRAGSDPVLAQAVRLSQAGTAVTIVHGGGPAVDAELHQRNLGTARIAGLRVTDAPILDVVVRILGRDVNAAVVAALRAAGGRAERIGGDDDGVFIARRLLVAGGDIGYVGEIEQVDAAPVRAVLERGAIPVVSPIGADRAGQRYNINADTAAGALAAALDVAAYVVVTDVEGVRLERTDPRSLIARMTAAQAHGYLARGIFTDGMLPKIQAALVAIDGGVPRALICGAGAGALAAALGGIAGTEIVA